MQVQVFPDRAIVTDRNSSVVLLGRDAYQLQYRNGGSPQSPVWYVDVYFDSGTGPVDVATGVRRDIYSLDLSRVVVGKSQLSWSNSEQGAVNAIVALTPILRAGNSCCPPPNLVDMSGATCNNILNPDFGLTQTQLTECVIPNIAFCEEVFREALTPEQVACICDAPPPEPCPIEIYANDTLFETVADPCVTPNFNLPVINEASAPVGSKVGPNWVVPTAESLCSLVTSSTTEEVVTCIISSGKRDAVRCDLLGDVEPADVQAQILDCVTTPAREAIRVILSPLKFALAAFTDTSITFTVTADEAGTYGTYTQDGGSGTLTYSLNGGSFVALTGTIVLAIGDTIAVRRTNTAAAGFIRWAQ
jgi:hypothetical protein